VLVTECSFGCECAPDCRNRGVQRGVGVPLEIFWAADATGWGVRSSVAIGKGQCVCEYAGEWVPSAVADARESDYVLYREATAPVGLDSSQAGNVGRFLNHSCEPNLVVRLVFVEHHDRSHRWRYARRGFFALREIAAGEELTWNYGPAFFGAGSGMTCACGAAKCRSTLRRRMRHTLE